MENQLQVVIKESGLETVKAQYILEKFQGYFAIAAEWEQKAKVIVVTNETQTAEMQMARAGRLFLREKRIAIEKTRKGLKEQALREGKAIDGISNILKALIVPTEEYLERQEKFVEIREAEKAKQKRLEVEQRIEEERIAKEKAEAEEQERIRIENERLKTEAIKQEKEREAERKKQAEILVAQKAKAEAEQRKIEEKARVEHEKQAKMLAEQQTKAEKEKKAIEEKAKKEQLAAKALQKKLQAQAEIERKEKQRLIDNLNRQIECPFCHKKFIPERKEKR